MTRFVFASFASPKALLELTPLTNWRSSSCVACSIHVVKNPCIFRASEAAAASSTRHVSLCKSASLLKTPWMRSSKTGAVCWHACCHALLPTRPSCRRQSSQVPVSGVLPALFGGALPVTCLDRLPPLHEEEAHLVPDRDPTGKRYTQELERRTSFGIFSISSFDNWCLVKWRIFSLTPSLIPLIRRKFFICFSVIRGSFGNKPEFFKSGNSTSGKSFRF